jgi:hypothetical protein
MPRPYVFEGATPYVFEGIQDATPYVFEQGATPLCV